jgi:multidrug resistance efflux pump
VEAGDTLGWFYSSETERQQAQLQAELASAAAGLELARAGEKEAVVREARQRLALAQAEWAQQRRQLARLQALLNQQMIEAETVERAQHAAAIQALQVEVAQAQLEAVSSGDREAQVALARARLEGARRQAEVLARRQRAGTLLAPLAGKLQGALSTDTLLVVRDLSRFALLVPVKWRDRGLLSPGQAVEVHTDTGPLPGVLEALDQALYPLEGEQVFFATVLAEGRSGELAPGLLVRCRIPCAPVGLVGYLKRFLLG